MRRACSWIVWSGLWLAVAPAASGGPPASPEQAVTSLVQRHLAAVAKRCRQPEDCAVDASTIAYTVLGPRWDYQDGDVWSDVVFTGFDGDIKIAPRTGVVVADSGVAWFQVPYRATLIPDPEPTKVERSDQRIGGIAVLDHGTWRLRALAYTDQESDRELFTEEPRGGWWKQKDLPQLEAKGDAKVARDVIAGWLQSGFASHAAATKLLVASGTSPAEFRRGAAALAMVKTWDKLKMVPWQIDVEPIAGTKLAFLSASVLMPIKKPGLYTRLVLFGVLVQDGADWRWVSLQYGSTFL